MRRYYLVGHDAEMNESADGDYVEFDEADCEIRELKDEIDELKIEIEHLKNMVSELSNDLRRRE